jgi:tungstate transport system substrate-binding protein
MRFCLSLALAVLLAGCGSGDGVGVLDMATTTSVRDSGLMDELLPRFRAQTGIEVRLLAVGSGAALRMGADGDVDVLLTHAPAGELELVEAGKLVDRRPFMRNHFVIAGPPQDPAGVGQAADARDAVRRVAAADAPFVSRADDSGTHRREQAVLTGAGLDPGATWGNVIRTNAGMGASLQVAGERRAYIVSDIGTFRAFRKRIELVALSKPDDPDLRNVYSVMRPNPEGRDLNVDGAILLAQFLTAPATQRRIGEFGRDPDPLFVPLQLEGDAG